MKRIITAAALAVLFAAFAALCACRLLDAPEAADPTPPPAEEGAFSDAAPSEEKPAAGARVLRAGLDEKQRSAYDAMEDQILAQPERIRLPKLDETALREVLSAFFGDHPDVISVGSRYSYKTSLLSSGLDFSPEYEEDAENALSLRAQLLQAARSVVDRMPASLSDEYEKELWLHDELVSGCVYGSGAYDATAYGALVLGRAVCEGYAKAAKLLFDLAGLESCVIEGRGAGGMSVGGDDGHMWNAVRVNGAWYYLDCTWDDPVSADGAQVLRHFYFNRDETAIRRTHFDFTPPSAVRCVSMDDCYFTRTGYYCAAEDWRDTVKSALADTPPGGGAELCFADEALFGEATRALFEEKEIWSLAPTFREWNSFTYSLDVGALSVFLQLEA